eukprot:5153364-Pyramimonas_sp.AAC.1
MNQELAKEEENLRDPDGNPQLNADFHLMRIRRLAKAWKAKQRTICLRGIVDHNGFAHAEPS